MATVSKLPSEDPFLLATQDIVNQIDSGNFDDCMRAFRSVTKLKIDVYKKMVSKYDPNSERGFCALIYFFSSFFQDKKDAASEFGVTVSTFYRWRSGETCPHPLVRDAVKQRIFQFLETKCLIYDDMSGHVSAAPTIH